MFCKVANVWGIETEGIHTNVNLPPSYGAWMCHRTMLDPS